MAEVGATDRTGTSRPEAFSDGAIAIAITLLVLDLRPPDLADASAAAVWRALADLWPGYLGFAISFWTVGVLWLNHHMVFRLVDRLGHGLNVANLFLLFCIALVPFPTSLVAEYRGHRGEQEAVIVCAGLFLAVAIAFNLVWWQAARADGRLLVRGVAPETVRSVTRRYRLGPPVYLLALVVAFLSPGASLAIIGLAAASYILPYGRRGAGQPEAPASGSTQTQ